MSDIRAIRNEADYNWALAEVEPYLRMNLPQAPLKPIASISFLPL